MDTMPGVTRGGDRLLRRELTVLVLVVVILCKDRYLLKNARMGA